MDRRLSRRKLASSIGALVLAVPGLSACGFGYATDKENNLVNGTNNQDGPVDVLNALVVSGEDGSGTFIASLANNTDEAISLDSLELENNASVAAFEPIEVPPRGLVNMSGEDKGVKVSGEFVNAGEFVGVTLTFSNGETVEMDAHVVAEDDEYDGLDNGTGAPSPAAG